MEGGKIGVPFQISTKIFLKQDGRHTDGEFTEKMKSSHVQCPFIFIR